MANMTLTKTPMPEQDPKVRARNFKRLPWAIPKRWPRKRQAAA